MANFVSAHRHFVTYLGKRKLAFTEGIYKTEIEEEINFLRNHPEFGRTLVEGGNQKKAHPTVVTGVRSAGLEDFRAKFKEYDELKSKCLKLDGSPRKDAIDSDLNRINELKIELEL